MNTLTSQNSGKVDRESTNVTIGDIKKILKKFFKAKPISHYDRKREIFRSHENTMMELTSRDTTLTNQILDELRKGTADLRKSLEFTEGEAEKKFRKSNEKLTSP